MVRTILARQCPAAPTTQRPRKPSGGRGAPHGSCSSKRRATCSPDGQSRIFPAYPSSRRRSVQVLVLDELGHYTRAGSEVRVYRAGSEDLLGLRIVDTGSGYNAQNAKPVHIGLRKLELVDIHIKTMSVSGGKTTRFERVDPGELKGKPFVARTAN